jgi:hypothetical protein
MSLLSTVILAAESEKSKVPYFIAGGLFALWAIVVSLIGLRSPDFPKNKAAGRATLLISVVLAAATFGLLIVVSN